MQADIALYKRNRDLLYDGLTALGFDCVRPDGAFYLFVKAPVPDARAVSEAAKERYLRDVEILMAPDSDLEAIKGFTGGVDFNGHINADE